MFDTLPSSLDLIIPDCWISRLALIFHYFSAGRYICLFGWLRVAEFAIVGYQEIKLAKHSISYYKRRSYPPVLVTLAGCSRQKDHHYQH